jgi:hypothetical protein
MLRIKTFFNLLKASKELRLFILIDVIFYVYAIFGFIIIAEIGSRYNMKIVTAIVVWSLIFLPILGLKMYKEITKNKHRTIYD